jgi:hypothetical protein
MGLTHTRGRATWGLGDVALSQICWTQDPSTSMERSPDLEGAWAGHGLAIIALSVFDKVTRGRDGWTDVTEECWREVSEIYLYNGE